MPGIRGIWSGAGEEFPSSRDSATPRTGLSTASEKSEQTHNNNAYYSLYFTAHQDLSASDPPHQAPLRSRNATQNQR